MDQPPIYFTGLTNWLQVRDALNRMSAEELREQKILVLGENHHLKDCTISQFTEDQYEDDYCILPESEMSADAEVDLTEQQPVYYKGQFFIDPDTYNGLDLSRPKEDNGLLFFHLPPNSNQNG